MINKIFNVKIKERKKFPSINIHYDYLKCKESDI